MKPTHVTAAGLKSMDPDKWLVGQFIEEDRSSHISWAIYPPQHTTPHLIYSTFDQAIRSAQRYAMFAVVPPETVPDMLRDNTIEEGITE